MKEAPTKATPSVLTPKLNKVDTDVATLAPSHAARPPLMLQLEHQRKLIRQMRGIRHFEQSATFRQIANNAIHHTDATIVDRGALKRALALSAWLVHGNHV